MFSVGENAANAAIQAEGDIMDCLKLLQNFLANDKKHKTMFIITAISTMNS
jgi:hypothetical protein